MSLNEIDNDLISNTATLEIEFNLSRSEALKVLKLLSKKNFAELERIIPNYKESNKFKKLLRIK